MDTADIHAQARFIFATGKLIRDRVVQIQSAHLSAMGDKGGFGELSLKQLQVVLMVGRHEPVSIKELAALGGVSAPSASAMVDRLVERGLLLRAPSREDRRRVLVRVAPAAREELDRMEALLLHAFVEIVQRIGPENAARWCEVLSAVKTVLEEDFRKMLSEREGG